MVCDTMSNIATRLATINVFSELSPEALEGIARLFTSNRFERGATLISQQDTSSNVYFLLEGKVRATLYSPAGKEVSYQELKPGDMFGEMAALDNLPRSTHVISLVKGELLTLTSDDFNRLIMTHPVFARAVLMKMVGVVRFLADRIFEYSTMNVGGRVRAELMRLAKQHQADARGFITIDDMPTHEELAGRLATHREAITRELGQLEKAGVIEKHRSKVTILDMGALGEAIN